MTIRGWLFWKIGNRIISVRNAMKQGYFDMRTHCGNCGKRRDSLPCWSCGAKRMAE